MCSEDQHKETLAALKAIKDSLQRRDNQYQTVPISDALAFVVDYKDRHFLYAWSTVALTLDAGSRGTFNLPAESWTQIALQPNIQVKTSGYGTTATQITLLATDKAVVPSGVPNLALETGGNLATIASGIGVTGANAPADAMQIGILSSNGKLVAPIADGNGYLKATLLNGTNQVNIAPNGALYTVYATNNASVPTGAGNTVIKASQGSIATLVVTTAGTGAGNVLIYDNASTNSGTVLFAFPATVSVAQSYQIYGWAKAGMVAQNVLNGPVFTVYFS
jgi:hypothetical protein